MEKDRVKEELPILKEILTILQNLIKDAEDSPDFSSGEELIRDSYFVAFAINLANSGLQASTIGIGIRQVLARLVSPNAKL